MWNDGCFPVLVCDSSWALGETPQAPDNLDCCDSWFPDGDCETEYAIVRFDAVSCKQNGKE